MGVIGVHGKPGLESAAQLVQTTDLVLAFGVHDCTTLLCNLAGMQVRPMIHFELDAVCVTFNSKYQASHTVIGNPSQAIEAILMKLDELSGSVAKAADAAADQPSLGYSLTAILAVQESGVDKTPAWQTQLSDCHG